MGNGFTDSTEAPTFDSVIHPLEKARVPLYYSLYTGRQLGVGRAGKYFDAYKKVTINSKNRLTKKKFVVLTFFHILNKFFFNGNHFLKLFLYKGMKKFMMRYLKQGYWV